MAADTAEDMAKDGKHIAPVDYNPGLVDHQRESWPPTIFQRNAMDELFKVVEA